MWPFVVNERTPRMVLDNICHTREKKKVNPMEPVTIRDITQELGLSTPAVSNMIHGKTGKIQ